MTQDKVVVVDDDVNIGFLVREYLKDMSFDVFIATDGKEALNIIKNTMPSMIILDIVLPQIDGFEVLKQLRKWSKIPVIVISAHGDLAHKTRCFEIGADDYLVKPFEYDELRMRVDAVLRRTRNNREATMTSIENNGLIIDFEKRMVFLDENEIYVTPIEYQILELLIRNTDKTFEYVDILRAVWGSEYANHTEYIHTFMRQIRNKIERDPRHPKYIQTIPRIGYRFHKNGS